MVSVHYTGYLMDGKIFDSSIERDEPRIPNWKRHGDKMGRRHCLYDKLEYRSIIIPSVLAWIGANGAGGVIPPNATLISDVELMNVK
jgi:peptidyl-prolyl cis-trans isomerase A (cyclophilin A)